MRILEIISQHRRDFRAIMVCEHCGNEQHNSHGYDDDNYHRNVIPDMNCQECGKKSPKDYRPMGTKYEAGEVI